MTFNIYNLNLPKETVVIDSDRAQLIKEIGTSKVIALDGFPGAGKSTIAKFIADEINAVVIEIDHFRTNQTGSFSLTESDESLISEIIDMVKTHERKIIIDGVLALDFLKKKNIQYDKYIWI